MPKKIVILNGSPRKNGNTSALVQAFREGAESAGHTVTEFHLASMDIHPCKGCWGGGKDSAHPCVQRDDMEQIILPTKKRTLLFWPARSIIGRSAANSR